jgi:predicted  nucleic acid-binding Zn-ribbon protein
MEERYHHLKDKYDHMEHECHELKEKLHRAESSGGHGSEKLKAELHYYKEKFEHVSHERDEMHRKLEHLEHEVTKRWEAKYHRIMKNNRELKERHRTLKVSYRSTGGHASSSSDSSSSHSD